MRRGVEERHKSLSDLHPNAPCSPLLQPGYCLSVRCGVHAQTFTLSSQHMLSSSDWGDMHANALGVDIFGDPTELQQGLSTLLQQAIEPI